MRLIKRLLRGDAFGSPRVTVDEIWNMTDRQLWDIWVEPAMKEAEAERRKKETEAGDDWDSNSDSRERPAPPSFPDAPHSGDAHAPTVFRDPDSHGGRFRWVVPKTSKKKAVCEVNGIPISGEAMLDNLKRAGLLSEEDVDRVRKEKAEALAAKAKEQQQQQGEGE